MRIAALLLALSFAAAGQQVLGGQAAVHTDSQPAGQGLPKVAAVSRQAWYDHAVIYEIYPRSFQDTNGDGVGDLKGVAQRLDYLKRLGVDAIWLTPFFPSPNLDFGYDISNYTDVAPEYGTMADWDHLVAEAKRCNIRILVDFVLNHTSSEHPWFVESASGRGSAKRNWYVWRDGKAANEPPTNWLSIFGGSTWTLDPDPRAHTASQPDQWYYHIFAPYQPDVNWADPGLREAMFDVVRFWLDHGASGFRLDAAPFLYEDQSYPDDPQPHSGAPGLKPYSNSRPENHGVMRELRRILDGYPGEPVLLGESPTADIESLALVYGKHHDEVQLPMDFMVGDLKELTAATLKKNIDEAETKLGGTATLFFSSHDHSRQLSLYGDGKHDVQIARISATATLLPGGTTLLYYGEELGMATTPKADLAGVPIGPKRPRADDRDGERTPMQWSGEAEAGFTTGTPWLPVQASHSTVNVASEEREAGSLLHWYEQLIALKKTDVFTAGTYVPLNSGNKQVFAFARMPVDGGGALVAMNLSAEAQTVQVTGAKLAFGGSRVLLGSAGVSAPAASRFTLPPFGVLVASVR